MFGILFFLLGASPNAFVDSTAYHYECRQIAAGVDTGTFAYTSYWAGAERTAQLVDLKTGELASLDSHCRLQWSDSCLYVRMEMEEPNLWATQAENERRIYLDNAFELFVDPDGDGLNYVEFEINGLGATWDLLMAKPYRAGGDAISCYDMRGVKKVVMLDGTINCSDDKDKGWIVTLAIPFENFRGLCAKPYPSAGDSWRVNLVRVQWELDVDGRSYVKRTNPETGRGIAHYWVWSPHGEVNMHKPEKFGYVEFK